MTLSDGSASPCSSLSSPTAGASAPPDAIVVPGAVSRERTGPWLQVGRPDGFEWNHATLPIASLPEALQNLRVLHLTDFHMQARWLDVYDQILHRIQSHPPDLLLFSGDFVDNKRNHRPALPFVRRLISGFRARFGCFAVTGNHDHPQLPADLAGSNITLIEHQRQVVNAGNASIELIGLIGHKRRHLNMDWVRSLPPKRTGMPRIAISHFPDSFGRTQSLDADLFLAGHTHGGQICLPGGWPLLRHDKLPRRLCKGIHRVNGAWLVVGRGLGFTTLPIRTWCPSEVIELRLVSESTGQTAPTI